MSAIPECSALHMMLMNAQDASLAVITNLWGYVMDQKHQDQAS